MPEIQTETVGKVLQDTGVPETEVNAAITQFCKAEINEVRDLKGKTEEDVKKEVKDILAKANPKLAHATAEKFLNAVVAQWKVEKGLPAGTPAATPVTPKESTNPVPKTGAVDVSATTVSTTTFQLKAEKEGTIATFTIPKLFESQGKPNYPFRPPKSLEEYEWILLARNNNLTKALNLTRILQGKDEKHAARAAFLWKLRPDAVNDMDKRIQNSTVSATVEEDRLSEVLGVDAKLAGSYAFCSASVSAAVKVETRKDLYCKVIYTRARDLHERCSLQLLQCLTIAPLFEYLIKCGLNEIKGTKIDEKDQFDFFTQLFEIFGHVVPETVLVGSLLEIKRDLLSIENQSHEVTKASLNTAIEYKANHPEAEGYPSADAKVGLTTEGSRLRTQADCFENMTITKLGGDTSQDSIDAWKKTTNKPEWWKIIKTDNTLLSITSFLSNERRDKIEKITKDRQEQAWQIPKLRELAQNDGGKWELPSVPLLPLIPLGEHVTLANMGDTEKPHRYLKAADGTPQPGIPLRDKTALDDESKDVHGRGIALNPANPANLPYRVEGVHYTWRQPAPVTVVEDKGSNPKKEELAWTLQYTGLLHDDVKKNLKEPLFWIVSQDGRWVLSAFRVPRERWSDKAETDGYPNAEFTVPTYVAFATLFPFEEEQKLRTISTPSKWVLRPAVPPGTAKKKLPELTHDQYEEEYFHIYNPFRGGCLAHYGRVGGTRHWKGEGRGFVAPGGGGGGYTPGGTYVAAVEAFWRTKLHMLPLEETPSVYDYGADKVTVKSNLQKQQEHNFLTRCWRIRTVNQRPKEKQFPLLANADMERWIAKHESELTPVAAT